ncbi:disulfide oxidoreductase [Niallia taxi]|nr:disulfide oxidoreductase [Niallia taxi]MCM3215716.1 disulfide oxidoreductase [Niallia taxi]MED4038512.1 disulfide oxidoreductase [Niallia taxi]
METKNKEKLLMAIWVVSTIATFGSLFFSEIMKFEPCKLCWLQRIFMYPLPIIVGLAIIRKDYNQIWSFLTLASIGFVISVYHNYIMLFPPELGSCGRVSCTTDYFHLLGFITIPLMALIAFIIVIVLCIIGLKMDKKSTFIVGENQE